MSCGKGGIRRGLVGIELGFLDNDGGVREESDVAGVIRWVWEIPT